MPWTAGPNSGTSARPTASNSTSVTARGTGSYYNDHCGWWHELLYELVHGCVSKAGVFFKGVLFEEWKDWFKHKDHQDALQGADKRAQRGHGPD